MKTKVISIISVIAFTFINTFAQSLNFTNNGTFANIGDIDVEGNQITVEALVYISGNNSIDVVSKHSKPGDVNYLLRPSSFQLTTYVTGNSGKTQFLQISNPFKLSQNEWYHIAGTYNGSMVKYYVNGCLVNSQPFTGNLYQNNLLTAIGNMNSCKCEQFFGKIDEVRIWSVARSQDEIQRNMLDLLAPNTQIGLVAYYKLNNSLVNIQGNPKWNGTLIGTVQFSNDEANIQPFAITDIEISNSDCQNPNNGSLKISTNRQHSQYSLNGFNFQSSNFFSNLPNGTHKLYVQSPEGCIIDSILTIKKKDFYFNFNISKTICQGESFAGYKKSGTYTDTLRATIGCDSLRTLNLSVTELPKITFSNLNEICQGQTITISPKFIPNTLPINYKWSTGEVTPSILVNKAGTYELTVESGKCYTKASTLISIVNPPTLKPNENICLTSSTVLLESGATELGLKYLWTPSNAVNSSLSVSQQGQYQVKVTSQAGCEATRIINVIDVPKILSDEITCKDKKLVAGKLDNNLSYLWEHSGEKTREVTVQNEGTYKVKISNQFGCSATRTISVVGPCSPKIFAPNAFTPNDDNVNDNFKIIIVGGTVKYLYIYNRWGNLIYTDTNPTNPQWDGIFKGEPCIEGTYTYRLIYKDFLDNDYQKDGTILLIR